MTTYSQSMTLGRFVKITFSNFRLLVQSITNTSTTVTMTAPVPLSAKRNQPSQHQPTGDDVEFRQPVEDDFNAAAGEQDEAVIPAASPPVQDERVDELIGREESGQLRVLVGELALPLESALESLLFVADEPVDIQQFARLFNLAQGEIEAALKQLDESYRAQNRGLRLQMRQGNYQLVTAPETAQLIEAFLNLDTTTRLSGPALETLAVIAYRQPVTRAQIEAVRGVDCSGVLRSLLQRGLAEELGRVDAPGRPVLYGVTDLFMHHFGLTGMDELPPLETQDAAKIDEALDL